jgi:hypothetical protein
MMMVMMMMMMMMMTTPNRANFWSQGDCVILWTPMSCLRRDWYPPRNSGHARIFLSPSWPTWYLDNGSYRMDVGACGCSPLDKCST